MPQEKIHSLKLILVGVNIILFLYAVVLGLQFLIPEIIANQPITDPLRDTSTIGKPVGALREVTLPLDQTVIINDLAISLSRTQPFTLGGNSLTLEIIDTGTGEPATIDRSIHFAEIHGYVFRDDLRGDIFHFHPESKAGLWQDTILISNPGLHHMVIEFPYKGVLYKLKSTFEVDDSLAQSFEEKDTVLAPLVSITFDNVVEYAHYSVSMHRPEKIVVGSPAVFTFSPFAQNNRYAFREKEESLANAHNFFVFHEGENFMWNEHGDSSVANLTIPDGLIVDRLPQDQVFYGYRVAFPKPGLWMLRFERSLAEAQFYVNVLELE